MPRMRHKARLSAYPACRFIRRSWLSLIGTRGKGSYGTDVSRGADDPISKASADHDPPRMRSMQPIVRRIWHCVELLKLCSCFWACLEFQIVASRHVVLLWYAGSPTKPTLRRRAGGRLSEGGHLHAQPDQCTCVQSSASQAYSHCSELDPPQSIFGPLQLQLKSVVHSAATFSRYVNFNDSNVVNKKSLLRTSANVGSVRSKHKI